MSDEQRSQKRTKGRSPAYPAISLDKAIHRVRQLYARDKQYATPVLSLPEIWGYSSLNGPTSLTISALKKFGLVDDEGARDERRITVTDTAVHILNHPSSDARSEAIRSAALQPAIHREMWEMYGKNLPSDANLEWRLTREQGFTETGAKEFIREWRETMEFAGLQELDRLEHESNDDTYSEVNGELEAAHIPVPEVAVLRDTATGYGEQVLPTGDSAARSSMAVQSYPIPIALQGRPPVVVSGPFPLTETEWAQFKAVLDAMRPVLVGRQEVEGEA